MPSQVEKDVFKEDEVINFASKTLLFAIIAESSFPDALTFQITLIYIALATSDK